ncbi:hypothetical protein RJ639_004363 [Escallonia herrerae]|uniref:DC1 domain-containing protein n=1 Tax=Escallonia herrerae TaxID=1293975 RepID=A0AA88W0V3_9ASTE|nr:hypothetical protein RJ639_004363 [Escallonia herrerae]
MGKVNQHQPYIQHFSHPHVLELTDLQNQPVLVPSSTPCSGCKLQLSGYAYTCQPCNFILHLSCTQLPRLITHPSHSNHTLSLLPMSTYPRGLFNCDACNRGGDGFSYHCAYCDFDLHVACASRPLSITHHSHPHPVQLTFSPPYETKSFSCDVCLKIGFKQWLYRCGACEFDVHMDCATARPLQHHNSFPGATNHLQYRPPTVAGQGSAPARPTYYMHSASTGALQSNPSAGTYGSGNAFMNAAVQGFIEGAAQQVGQTFMRSVIGGGSDGGDGIGGGGADLSGGDSSSTSILDVGSLFPGSILGDSDAQS